MYRREHGHQLLFEDFFLWPTDTNPRPFAVTARKDDAFAAVQAAMFNVDGMNSIYAGGIEPHHFRLTPTVDRP